MSPALAAEGGFLLGAFSANRKVVRFAPTTTLHAKYDDSHELRQLTPTTTIHAHCHDLRQLRFFTPTATICAHCDDLRPLRFFTPTRTSSPTTITPRNLRPARADPHPAVCGQVHPTASRRLLWIPTFKVLPRPLRPKVMLASPFWNLLPHCPLGGQVHPTASRRLLWIPTFKPLPRSLCPKVMLASPFWNLLTLRSLPSPQQARDSPAVQDSRALIPLPPKAPSLHQPLFHLGKPGPTPSEPQAKQPVVPVSSLHRLAPPPPGSHADDLAAWPAPHSTPHQPEPPGP